MFRTVISGVVVWGGIYYRPLIILFFNLKEDFIMARLANVTFIRKFLVDSIITADYLNSSDLYDWQESIVEEKMREIKKLSDEELDIACEYIKHGPNHGVRNISKDLMELTCYMPLCTANVLGQKIKVHTFYDLAYPAYALLQVTINGESISLLHDPFKKHELYEFLNDILYLQY